MSAVVMFGLVAFFAVPGQQVNTIGTLLPIVVGAGALLACEVFGFRGVVAESARHDKKKTMARARAAFSATTVLRFVLAETPALVGFALAFSGQPSTRVPVWIGARLAFALFALVAFPGRRQIAKLSTDRKVQANLERDGQPSYLAEAIGVQSTDDFSSSQSGPIQEIGKPRLSSWPKDRR